MTMMGKTCPVRARAFSLSWDKRARRAAMSPLRTACFDIFSPPPGAREVMTQVERLSSSETKIALRSVRIAACLSGRGQRACMVAPAWVVQHPTLPESRVLPIAPMGSSCEPPPGSTTTLGRMAGARRSCRSDRPVKPVWSFCASGPRRRCWIRRSCEPGWPRLPARWAGSIRLEIERRPDQYACHRSQRPMGRDRTPGMGSTNQTDTFIAVAPDCPAKDAEIPAKPESVAGLQYAMLHDQPYRLTSDDLLFAVHARRNGIVDPAAMTEAREAFFARSQACLRTSPLAKRYGWGIHYDARGRVAIYGVGTRAYRDFVRCAELKQVCAMRNRRG